MENRKMFGVGARYTVDRAQFADAVGRTERGDPLDTGVAVGGVGGVELVAAADPTDLGSLQIASLMVKA
jgi:hypothetical protein